MSFLPELDLLFHLLSQLFVPIFNLIFCSLLSINTLGAPCRNSQIINRVNFTILFLSRPRDQTFTFIPIKRNLLKRYSSFQIPFLLIQRTYFNRFIPLEFIVFDLTMRSRSQMRYFSEEGQVQKSPTLHLAIEIKYNQQVQKYQCLVYIYHLLILFVLIVSHSLCIFQRLVKTYKINLGEKMMIRNIQRLCFTLSSGKKIPRPRDPTVAQSFQTKISNEQVQILIDPKGFMSQQDKIHEQNNTLQSQSTQKQQETTVNQSSGVKHKQMEPQYGFKPKGPEPTRYGDWQVKGKCVDF